MEILKPEAGLNESGTRCCRCGQEWADAAPMITIDCATVGQRQIEGCDQCGTDEHLVDVQR